MLISFTCPHCGVTKQVLKDFVGRTGPCAACGATVTIHPAGAAPSDRAPLSEQSRRELLRADRGTRLRCV